MEGGDNMAVEYDYNYMRGWVRQHFKTNKAYADFLGIGETALYDRLACRVPFSQKEIDITAHFGNCSMEEVQKLFFTRKIRKTV